MERWLTAGTGNDSRGEFAGEEKEIGVKARENEKEKVIETEMPREIKVT